MTRILPLQSLLSFKNKSDGRTNLNPPPLSKCGDIKILDTNWVRISNTYAKGANKRQLWRSIHIRLARQCVFKCVILAASYNVAIPRDFLGTEHANFALDRGMFFLNILLDT